MTTVTLEQAQASLAELVHASSLGEEIVITDGDHPVARLIVTREVPARSPRRLGTLKGTVLAMAPDFDAPLEDFREYGE